jgi:hypothetical protein
MNTTHRCESRGARLDPPATVCSYRGSLHGCVSLDALDAVVRSTEGRLAASQTVADVLLIPVFLVLLAAVVSTWFLGSGYGLSQIANIALVVAAAFGGAIAFGWLVEFVEQKAIDNCYAKQTSKEIAAFLADSCLHRLEFDERAAKILDEKAKLRRFLFRP